MAKNGKATHVVTHDSWYLRVEGKMQEVKRGTELTLTKKQAEKAIDHGFIAEISDAEPLAVAGGGTKEQAKEIKALGKSVEGLTAEVEKLTADLATETAAKDEAVSEVEKLTKPE